MLGSFAPKRFRVQVALPTGRDRRADRNRGAILSFESAPNVLATSAAVGLDSFRLEQVLLTHDIAGAADSLPLDLAKTITFQSCLGICNVRPRDHRPQIRTL